MARQPTRKPAKRSRAPAEPRRSAASEEARSGLAGVSKRLDEWVDFFKNIGWIFLIVGGVFTFGWNFVGKPWAQQFVSSSVQETISGLQKDIADLRVAIEEGRSTDAETKAQLQALVAQLEMLQKIAEAGQENQQQILELLQKPKK